MEEDPMHRAAFFVALLLLAVTVLATVTCTGGDGRVSAAEVVRSDAPRSPADPAAGQDVAAAVEAFGTDLYGVLAPADGNLVFSPYSAAVALAMTRAGAAGDTAAQMDVVLHANLAGDLGAGFNALGQALAERPGKYPVGDQTVELELVTANQLWGQHGFPFERAFLDRLAAEYGAGLRLVDYVEARDVARAAINGWVADQTRGRIPELIPAGVLNDLTRLVLTNAIYLKAPWQHPFDDGATVPGPFHRLDGTDVEAQMMRTQAPLRYGSGNGYEAVELPYVGGALSMVVVVPEHGAFMDFEKRLNGSLLPAVVDSLSPSEVQLRFPRFAFRTQTQLKAALSALGMPIAFTEDADFSAMSPRGDELQIQDVLHEAFISVDEQGTEAAAATAVVVGTTAAPAKVVEFTVDRPFLFFIRDTETGALLFMGRVLDPSA